MTPLFYSSVVWGFTHLFLWRPDVVKNAIGEFRTDETLLKAQYKLESIGGRTRLPKTPKNLAYMTVPAVSPQDASREIAKILVQGGRTFENLGRSKNMIKRFTSRLTRMGREGDEGSGVGFGRVGGDLTGVGQLSSLEQQVERVSMDCGKEERLYPRMAPAVYFAGIATSLLNHGFPVHGHPRAKRVMSDLDRVTIGLAGVYDTAVAWGESSDLRRGLLLGLQYTAVRSFVQAKKLGGRSSSGAKAVFYHATAHALCTAHHAIVLKGIGKDWGNDWGEKIRDFGERRGGVVGAVLRDVRSPFENTGFKAMVFGSIGGNIAMTTKRAWAF